MVTSVPPRSEVPVELTWELESIFSSDQDWETQFASISAQLPQLASLQGTLSTSAGHLLHALQLRDQLSETIERLFVYATMRFHEDTTRTEYQAFTDRVMALVTEYSAATAYFVPEILTISQEHIDAFLANTQGLVVYRHQLEEITRARPHVRSAEVEQVLAGMAEIAPSAGACLRDDRQRRFAPAKHHRRRGQHRPTQQRQLWCLRPQCEPRGA